MAWYFGARASATTILTCIDISVLVASRKLASTGILRAASANGCLSGWYLKVWLSSILPT